MTSLDKVTNGLGIDVRDLIKATLTGKAIGNSINTLPIENKKVEDDSFIDEVISKA